MNLSERIKAILDETKADQVELAAAAGVTKGTVNQWLTGDIKSIKLEYAVGIQEKFGYNAVWIVLDKEPRMAAPDSARMPLTIPIEPQPPVPTMAAAPLGDDGDWSALEHLAAGDSAYVHFPTLDPDAYALRCDGDSMKPRIQAGEFVVIEPRQPVEPGDDVLLKRKDGRVMLKRYLYKRDGRIYVISINEAHAPTAFSDGEIEKMEFVRAICRPGPRRHE